LLTYYSKKKKTNFSERMLFILIDYFTT